MVGGDIHSENSIWTRDEDKLFENFLVEFNDDYPDRWEIISAMMGTKSALEVEQHYVILLDDLMAIEGGQIELPDYANFDVLRSPETLMMTKSEKKQAVVQRKAARPWTDDEHRKFLDGLEKYGKGDWKSISRYMVKTRNPSQVASHAQKYFERQEKEDQDKKRRSIFDSSTGDDKSRNS